MRKVLANSKGISGFIQVVVGLVLIMALAIALNALFTFRNLQNTNQLQQPISQSVSPTPATDVSQADPTVGWETYTDTTLGFSIKHPPLWVVHTNPAVGLGFSFQSPDLQTDQVGKVKTGAYVGVIIIPNPADVSIQDWSAQNSNQLGAKRLSEETATYIAGYPALLYDEDIDLWGRAHVAVVSGKAKFFRFDLFYADTERLNAMNVFDQMIATLRILP